MSLQTIEPFDSAEHDWEPTAPSVTLKEAIDLEALATGGSVQFEVDLSAPLPGDGGGRGQGAESLEGEAAMDNMLEQLNMDPLGVGGGEDSDSDQDDSPFQIMARSMENLSRDGGVLKKLLHLGIGDDVPERALVRVHYNGYLEYADEPFDSTRLRGRQQQFTLGKGEVIAGLEVAVRSMRRNERSQFLISSNYAFGKMGCPPRIPPNATILFEVELLGFVESSGIEEEGGSGEQERNLSFEDRLAIANSEREIGNDYFQQNMTGRAVGKYLRAVRQLEAMRLRDEEQEVVWRVSLKKLYLNLSLCNLKQRKSQLALSNCRRVLELDGRNVKAFFRIGQAYLQLGDFGSCRKYLNKANRLSPHNKEVQQELKKLEDTRKRFQTMERTLYSNMFRQPAGRDSRDGEKEAIVPYHTREHLVKKLREMKEDPQMLELVLPECLGKEEVACAGEVARELGLKTEKNPQCGLRVFKPGVQPEDFEQYLH